MKTRGLLLSVLLICTSMLLVISCGGGGGGGGDGDGGGGGGGESTTPGFTPVDIGTLMTVDQSNAIKTTGLAFFAHQINSTAGTGDFIPLGQDSDNNKITPSPSLMETILRTVAGQIDLQPAYTASSETSETAACDGGGTIKASLEWTGPDDPTSYCDLVDLHGTLSVSGCTDEYGTYMNGTIDLVYSGEYCQPTTISTTMTDFTFSDSGESMETRRLQIIASQLSWTSQVPYGSLYAGHFVATGQVVATVDGESVALAFNNYTEDLSDSSLAISGLIYGPCLDGWAELSTNDPIQLEDEYCPTAGHLVISGDGDATIDVLINDDGTITVDGTNIGSCEELDLTCPVS